MNWFEMTIGLLGGLKAFAAFGYARHRHLRKCSSHFRGNEHDAGVGVDGKLDLTTVFPFLII
jgi:hypothetical protein